MSSSLLDRHRPPVGLVGFGAFGRLIAQYLTPHVHLQAFDPHVPQADFAGSGAEAVSLEEAVGCTVVILAVPVSGLAAVVDTIAPLLKPGTLVIDVGSVKTLPVQIMCAGLPPSIEILATHPLFGPQSARDGIAGLKITLCPVRGQRWGRVAAFLRDVLALDLIFTTPEEHDREAAVAQGLTHLIAKVLVSMEPLPTRVTTRSFELLIEAIGMVRHDAPEVYWAIERLNPYAAEVRQRFFTLASELGAETVNTGPCEAD